MNHPPELVRAHFGPHTRGLTWHRAASGLSGARVWCGTAAGVPRVALKAWPPHTEPARLGPIHRWMIRAEHLPFVPRVLCGAGGSAVVTADGRVWDCCRWVPGEPRPTPTPADIATACEAVADLHAAWDAETHRGPSPGVQTRLRALAENEPLLRAGPKALPPVSPDLDPLLRQAVDVVAGRAAGVAAALAPWERHPFALHPCVRDLRGEHVLFDADRVTGVIDYGAAAVDHPAVDLVRFLGDYAHPDDPLFAAGVRAYRAARPAFDAPDEFVRALAAAGPVCSVLGWLVRLAVRREPPADPAGAAARLARMLARLGESPRN